MFKKLSAIVQKALTDHLGKISSARVSSFIILAQIILTSMVFIAIELINANVMWDQNLIYVIPTEHIIIFGMVLTHHLFLLGIKKSSEASSFPSLDNQIAFNSSKKNKTTTESSEVEGDMSEEA
jgi:hypothetical protein